MSVPSNPISEDLSRSLSVCISALPTVLLVETILRVSVKQQGELGHVAAVMETALEHYEGSKVSLSHLLPVEGINQLILTCWKERCLLTWYCLVRNQNQTGVDDVGSTVVHMLSGCKSMLLR